MALFGWDRDRDYGADFRDYGPRGRGGYTDRAGWRMNGDYDAEFGARDRRWYGGAWGGGRGREGDEFGTGWGVSRSRYGHDYGAGFRSTRYDRGLFGSPDYDRSYRGATEYDRGYKSRWQTDYGDPFHDREQRTPMRVIQGEARGYDVGLRTSGWGREREDTGYAMGYRPYSSRAGYDTGYRRGYNAFGGDRYDTGWY